MAALTIRRPRRQPADYVSRDSEQGRPSVGNRCGRPDQLDAAAAGAELVDPELELAEEVEPDFSDDEEGLLDSEPLADPFDAVAELVVELLAASRLSVR
jgi:hypothetical protein